MVRSIEEREGCIHLGEGIDEFNNFILRGELLDLPLAGKKFSLFGPNNRRSRLDRFLISSGTCFKDLEQSIGRRSVSVHAPIFLFSGIINWGPKPFKFLNCWLLNKDFILMTKNKWEELEAPGSNVSCVNQGFKMRS
ncbi:hypothetical protein REPUB_Repub10bG0113700 [Reevesia pubescens]